MSSNFAKPVFKNKAQEKAWRKSFTPENHYAAKLLREDLNRIGPEGVARRDKARHLAAEAKDDAYAVGQAREQFKQAAELKHTLYDPNESRYRRRAWENKVAAFQATVLPKVLDWLCKARCFLLGHHWGKTAFQDNALVYKYHRKCERRGAIAAAGYHNYGCEARQEI